MNLCSDFTYFGIKFCKYFKVTFKICCKYGFNNKEAEAIEFSFLQVTQPIKLFVREQQSPGRSSVMTF